tara:strand:- start:612 stop:1121 length:510 start_codon:yes stop_codon:yes gene_type:complete
MEADRESSADDNFVRCPYCKEHLEIPLNYIGVLGCPLCKNQFKIDKNRKIFKRRKTTIQQTQESRKKISDEKKEILSLTINDTKKYLKESKESRESVLNIYLGTCLLLLVVGIIGVVEQSITIILSSIFSYFSLSYFYQMWNNLSINTSFSNIIEIDRLLKEELTLEEE